MSKTRSATKDTNQENVDIGISSNNLKSITNLLNEDLADEYLLLTKTKKYHWNVIDPRFNDIHKFLDEQYSLLAESVDEVAERIRYTWG